MPTLNPESVVEEIEFISKGQVTIPKRLRDSYHIQPGLKGFLIPIPGAMILVPTEPKTPVLLDKLREGLGTQDMSLAEMIAEMQRIRETSDYEA
jgi:bifunctional DNA-binding transcriptional regulator/antitoxin component of YhaV-PrlF toxin-antitoxin module